MRGSASSIVLYETALIENFRSTREHIHLFWATYTHNVRTDRKLMESVKTKSSEPIYGRVDLCAPECGSRSRAGFIDLSRNWFVPVVIPAKSMCVWCCSERWKLIKGKVPCRVFSGGLYCFAGVGVFRFVVFVVLVLNVIIISLVSLKIITCLFQSFLFYFYWKK